MHLSQLTNVHVLMPVPHELTGRHITAIPISNQTWVF